MSDLKNAALGTLGFCAMLTDKAFDGFDQSNAFTTADEGGNHAAWVAGHLAQTCDWVLGNFAGSAELDESYKSLFGMDSAPGAEADYPPFADLLAQLKERRQAMQDWFSGLTDEQAAAELDEEYRMFGQTVAGMIGAIGAHENYHCGQLSVVRKKLGIGRVFG